MEIKKKEIENLVFKSYLEEMLQKKKFLKMNRYIQHGNTSCLLHSIAVSYYSYRLCKFFRIKVHEKELIRGALLHDYFLYDWHQKYNPSRNVGLHGRVHPKIALFNARKDFSINYLEEDIIEKHMFPLTFYFPKYRESIIICLVDKACSLYETFKKNAYFKITENMIDTKKERRIIAKRVNLYN